MYQMKTIKTNMFARNYHQAVEQMNKGPFGSGFVHVNMCCIMVWLPDEGFDSETHHSLFVFKVLSDNPMTIKS